MEIKEKINELQHEIEASFREKERLTAENSIFKKRIEAFESQIKIIHETVNRCTCIGLIDLDNKIKEAEYNALHFFEKKCPYCGKGIFDGHIRNKINIDHFWPIVKGGQHIPWNILPICGHCNRKKKDKLPFEFLEPDKYIECLNYLESVRKKYGDETQTCAEMIAKIKGSILNEGHLPAYEVIKRLYNILGIQEPSFYNLNVFEKYKLYEDSLAKFIEECCVVHQEKQVAFADFYNMFTEWWMRNTDNQPPKRKRVGQLIGKRFRKEKPGGRVVIYGLEVKREEDENNSTRDSEDGSLK